MSKQTEALKLAREALSPWASEDANHTEQYAAYHAIREALAEQETVLPGGGHVPAVPVAVYGYCPECGGAGVMRERRPNGDDKCTNGHKYPSSKALAEQPAQQQEPVAWINWCAATGNRSVSFECESELASQPLYEGITQNTQYHYSKFHSWFDSELHRQKYTQDHPAYLAAQEAWNAANDAAQHRINRLNAEIEAWKVRFKIAEDALAKLNGQEQKPVAWADINALTEQFNSVNCGTAYRLPGEGREPLYTSPPASKPWVGLTDDEICKMTVLMGINPDWKPEMEIVRSAVRNLEAKLREKNT